MRRIYDKWHRETGSSIPAGDKPALELGSGAGFMSSYVENLITSGILELPEAGSGHRHCCSRTPACAELQC